MAEPAKPAQRAQLRAARDGFVRGLDAAERMTLERRAAKNLLPLMPSAARIAFYHALGSEMGCDAAIAAAVAAGWEIALPHVAGLGAPMRFLRWAPGEPLETGWRGLVQPVSGAPVVDPDIVVTPLLGFDSRLRRLGQGAGFYDRAFAGLPHAGKIGWGWSIQQVGAIACDPWDVPLDAVVTETGVIGGWKP